MAGPITDLYCLRCYEPLRAFGGSSKCRTCDHVNLRADHSVYWTREPRLIERERLAKAVTLVLAASIAVALFRYQDRIGWGEAWTIGAPTIAGLVMWETASMITRRSPYFRAGIVWSALFAIISLPVLAMSLAPEFGPKTRASLAVAGGGVLLLAFAMPHVSRWLRSWREQRISRSRARRMALEELS